jgi:5-methylcytosine-specific restriction endonuclease McrA
MADPYPKSRQLARGRRRYRRKVASPKQWQAIEAAKLAPCRICDAPVVELHHIVPRDLGGNDVPDNIVPLCPLCHKRITERWPLHGNALVRSLTDAEYSHAVEKAGENVWERVYGIEYTR